MVRCKRGPRFGLVVFRPHSAQSFLVEWFVFPLFSHFLSYFPMFTISKPSPTMNKDCNNKRNMSVSISQGATSNDHEKLRVDFSRAAPPPSSPRCSHASLMRPTALELAVVKDGFSRLQNKQNDLDSGWESLNTPAKEEILAQLNQELADLNERLHFIEKQHPDFES